MFKYQNI